MIEDRFENLPRTEVFAFFFQQVNRLEITPDKRYLAAAGNPHIRLFDVNSNSPQPVCFVPSHLSNLFCNCNRSFPREFLTLLD